MTTRAPPNPQAKAGKLKPAEFSSGTFTVSNLGMFGVSQFGAILPPGTGAILAVGGAAPVVQAPPHPAIRLTAV